MKWYNLFIIVATLALVSVVFNYRSTHQQLTINFDMAITSDNEFTAGQLFYNTGNGYREEDSHIFPIRCDGTQQRYSLQVPYHRRQHLRFDPTNDSGEIRIANMSITTNKHITPIAVKIRNISAMQHIETIRYKKNTVVINTDKNSKDPSLLLLIDATKLFPREIVYYFFFWLRLTLTCFLFLFIVLQAHKA